MNNYQSIATINAPEFINLEPLDINPMMSKCEIKVLYLGANRNGTSINKEAASEMAKTLRGAPIVGYYKQNTQDFFDHGEQIIYDGEGVHFNTLTKPYGFVAPDAKVWFQEFEEFNEAGESTTRIYMMTTGYLWTGQYKEAQQVFNEGGKGQSMELDENSLSGFWSKEENSDMEFFIINDAVFTKLCILGDDVEPCFEGSSITAPNISKTFSLDDDFKKTLFSMMKELQYTLQGGTEKVEDENKKKSVDSSTPEETVVEPIVENPDESLDNTNENSSTETNSTEQETNGSEETGNENTGSEEDSTESNEGASDASDGAGEGDGAGDSGSGDGSSYTKKDDEEKKESSEDGEDADDKKDEDDSDEEDPKKKYALIVEKFEELQASFTALKEENDKAVAELTTLREYVKNTENDKKDALIAEFYMLSDEDKKDVIDHKTEYSLDEIKSKLAVLCYDKKISYTKSDEDTNDTTVNINDFSDTNTPAWVQAVINHNNQ